MPHNPRFLQNPLCSPHHPVPTTQGILNIVVIQSLSHVRLCNPKDCSMPDSLSFTVSWSLLRFMSIESGMPSNHLILCCLLLLLPSIFPRISVLSKESAHRIGWPKYWRFSFDISPSNEYSWLISFRIDWFDLLAGQGILKNLLQHHSLKASTLLGSATQRVA